MARKGIEPLGALKNRLLPPEIRAKNSPGGALNTDALTNRATEALLALDDTFISTPDYMGLAYFWHHAYRHHLRDASYRVRQMVHQDLLDAGLPTDSESAAHLSVIQRRVR